MTSNNPTTEDSTGIRPRYIPLGVDGDNTHHVYRTVDETVFAITDSGRVAHREPLARSVDDWMAFVSHKRGWQRQQYYSDLGRLFADHLEVPADA